MKYTPTSAVTILDFTLIMMTAVWIIVNMSKSGFEDIIYNIVYVTINITTLLLNMNLLRER